MVLLSRRGVLSKELELFRRSRSFAATCVVTYRESAGAVHTGTLFFQDSSGEESRILLGVDARQRPREGHQSHGMSRALRDEYTKNSRTPRMS